MAASRLERVHHHHEAHSNDAVDGDRHKLSARPCEGDRVVSDRDRGCLFLTLPPALTHAVEFFTGVTLKAVGCLEVARHPSGGYRAYGEPEVVTAHFPLVRSAADLLYDAATWRLDALLLRWRPTPSSSCSSSQEGPSRERSGVSARASRPTIPSSRRARPSSAPYTSRARQREADSSEASRAWASAPLELAVPTVRRLERRLETFSTRGEPPGWRSPNGRRRLRRSASCRPRSSWLRLPATPLR